MNQILKYGDLVFLNIFDMKKQLPQSVSEASINGLLGCNGFIEKNLWVKFFKSEKKNEKSDNIKKMLNQNKSFDYKTCLFKVLPGLSFIFFKEKLKTEERIKNLQQNIDRFESGELDEFCENSEEIQLIEEKIQPKIQQDFNEKAVNNQEKINHLKNILRNEKERLIKIKQNYELEIRDNELKKKEFCGKFVNYEDQIILQHYVSEYFISVSNQNNKQNSLNKKAVLQPYLSKQVMLSFKPRFKYRTQDSYIHYNDDIILTTLKKEFCLKYQKEKAIPEDNKQFQFLLRKDIRKNYSHQFEYKCYFSNDQPQIWRIVFFSADNIQKEIIQGGDFIRILHLNNEEYLSVDLSYESFKNRREELFIPKKLHKTRQTACSIWEVNHSESQYLSENFICQNPNVKKRKKNSNLYLKNFLLQRLVVINHKQSVLNQRFNYYDEENQNQDHSRDTLRSDLKRNSITSQSSNENESFNEQKYSENQFYSIVELNQYQLDEIRFQFLSILQNVDSLTNQNAYYLFSRFGYLATDNNTLEGFWQEDQIKQFQDGFTEDDFWSKYKKNVQKSKHQEDHIEKKKQFYPFVSSKEQKKYEVVYKENVSADNTYLVEKLSKEEIREIYFLKSFLFYLMKIRDKIFESQTLRVLYSQKIEQQIKQYILFLHNQDQFERLEVQSLKTKKYEINEKRQLMACEFQIIDLFTDILYLCQQENDFGKSRKSKIQLQLLEKVARLINEALQSTIKNNKQNIQYCSQWFELFVRISIKNSKYNMNLDVEQILIQLVKQNFLLIKNRIAKATIEKFIQLLIRYKNHQHIQILRNIIKCENNIVYKNQREITILLLKDQDKKEKFLFQIHEDNNKNFLISLPVLGWNKVDLNKLALDYYFEESNSDYVFFYKAIKLISELAQSRNYLCIDIVRKQVCFSQLIKFIRYLNEQNMQLKIVFIKLLNSVYVEVYNNCTQEYQSPLRFICGTKANYGTQIYQNQKQYKDSQQKKRARSYSDSDENDLSNNMDSDLDIHNSQDFSESSKDQKKTNMKMNSIEIQKVDNTNLETLNQFIKQILQKILEKIRDNQFEFHFIKYIKQSLVFLKILLKIEIIQSNNHKAFYDLLIQIILELEKRKFYAKTEDLQNYWEQKTENTLVQIKIQFCKIIKIFGLKNFKDQITKAYGYNKNNFKKEIVLEKIFQLEKKKGNKSFIQYDQLQDIFTNFIVKNENKDHKLTRVTINSIYFFISQYKYIQNDLDKSVFIKQNNEHIFQYFYHFSVKLKQIAENCQTWLLVDSENQILELKNLLVEFFGIILRSIKEKSTIKNFDPHIEIDSTDLLQLKKFSTVEFVLYYINFFFNMEKTECFLFIQRLSVALPIIRSFFTILSWSYKFRHFGNLKFKKDQRLMYLLIAILCYENDLGIDFIVKNYEDLLIDLYERNEDFCIVFINYCKSETHFLEKIVNKSNSLYNFFYVILKRCAHKNQNDLFKSYNFNILSQILSQQKLRENQRVFNNIQLYIFLNLKKQHNLKLLLRDSVQIEEQSKKNFQKMKLHYYQVLIVPPELCLSFSILQLVKTFAIGDSKLTKSVCQSFYSISSISKILTSNNINTFFKVEIMDFLNKVYLYKENTNIFNFKEIITHIWIKVIRHIENSLIVESSQSFDNKIFAQNQNEEQLYFMLTTTFKSRQELKEKYRKVLMKCIKLIIKKQISLKLNELDKMSYFSGLIDFLTFGIKVKDNDFNMQFCKIVKILKENWSPGLSKKEKIIENLLKEMQHDIYASDKEELDENIALKETTKQNQTQKKQISINFKRMSFLKLKKTSINKQKIQNINPFNILEKKIAEEDQLMFKQIIQMNTNKKPHYVKLFLQNIIYYLDKEINPLVKVDNIIVILKIFRSYIENVHPEKICCLDWSENFYDDFTEEIQRKQNELIDIGIIQLIVSNIKFHTQDFEIFQETILLAIALLYGGNKIAQQQFYNLFTQNKDNKFLQILKQKFDYFFDYLKKEFEIISIAYIQQYLRNSDKDFLKPLKKKFGLQDWKRRIKAIEMIFRFMQLLCEGHNILLQHYLREQFKIYDLKRSKSINFIELAAQSFGLIVKYLNPEILSIGEQILDFIIESVQGPCVENQKQLFKAKIVDYCNDMFLEFNIPQRMKVQGFYQHENNSKLNSFVVKAVRLLSSLIEASDDENTKKYMADHIHCQYLINHLTKGFLNFAQKIPKFQKTFKIYRQYKRENIKEYDLNMLPSQQDENDYLNTAQDFKTEDNQQNERFDQEKFLKIIDFSRFDNEACALFEIFFLLKFLSGYNEKIKYKLNQLKENDQLSFQFFDAFTGKVEIVYKKKIQNFLFIIHPCCYYIEKKQLNYLLRGIKRDTPKDKVKDIIYFSENIYLVMQHRCKLYYKFKKYGINLEFYNIIDFLITLFGFAINLFMLLFFRKKLKYGYAIEDEFYNEKNIIFMCLGYILFILQLFRLYLWFFIEGSVEFKKFLHMTIKKLKNEIKDLEQKDKLKTQYDEKSQNIKEQKARLNQLNIDTEDTIQLYSHYYKLQKRDFLPVKMIFYIKLIRFFLDNKKLKYQITFLIFCIFSLFFNYTFLYSLFLMNIIHHFDILTNLMYALTKNRKQLFITALLAVLVTYFFSVFAFIYLSPDFYMSAKKENICTSIFHCFLSILSLGPRSTGSIGDVILDVSYGDKVHYFIRWVFDFSIWCLINLILLNVIFGVTIDTFAELRDLNKAIDDDLQNKCIICSLERSLLEKYSEGFKYHTKYEHNLDNYLYFIFYLNNKEKTELTGLESYISENLTKNDIKWIPILRAKSLENKKIIRYEDEEGKSVDQLLEEIQKLKEFCPQ